MDVIYHIANNLENLLLGILPEFQLISYEKRSQKFIHIGIFRTHMHMHMHMPHSIQNNVRIDKNNSTSIKFYQPSYATPPVTMAWD